MSNNISGTGFIGGSGIIQFYNIPIDEPTNLSVINNRGRSATIIFTPPSGIIDGYNVYDSGSLLGSYTGYNSITLSNLEFKTYNITLQAYNSAVVSPISSSSVSFYPIRYRGTYTVNGTYTSSINNGYIQLNFTNPGAASFTLDSSSTVYFLAVAGGGAGGGGGGIAGKNDPSNRASGGGGAGGYILNNTGVITDSGSYNISVGKGGITFTNGAYDLSASLIKGGNTILSIGNTYTAIGGGNGGANQIGVSSGGSGGGCYSDYTRVNPDNRKPGIGTFQQGCSGGFGGESNPIYIAGGGGGAYTDASYTSSIGSNVANIYSGGNGGKGITISDSSIVSGSSKYLPGFTPFTNALGTIISSFCGGGGGGSQVTASGQTIRYGGTGGTGGGGNGAYSNLVSTGVWNGSNGSSGTPNTGGGGGGGSQTETVSPPTIRYEPGNGGSGVAIVILS